MGLLDDAIREHLDLKRRRGADPAEIERAEQEALGPVRREPIGGEEGAGLAPEAGLEAPTGEEAPFEPAPALDPPAAHLAGDDSHLGEEEEWDEYDDEEYELGEDLGPAASDLGPGAPAEPPIVPPPTLAEPLEPLPPDADEHLQATTSYEVPDTHPPARKHAEGEGDSEGEDVLEETPEFLQDTPDHDRLWFEQRPPKDFDFDE